MPLCFDTVRNVTPSYAEVIVARPAGNAGDDGVDQA
jgi:hypothetical protein